MENISRAQNPIIYSDFPDPDIIRVGDTYYMASTTMYYMPGCDILRSYDLINWELLDQVYDSLEDNDAHNMTGDKNIFGQGMWAPSLCHHNGKFYLNFTANDTKKTYLFSADNAEGPWTRHNIEGFYHDSSLFFDDDGSVYIVYGNTTLWLTQLSEDLSGPKPGGLHRAIIEDDKGITLGYEGSHMYKRDGKYYVFTCHMHSRDGGRKTEDCFIADSIEGEFVGRCIINDDMGYHGFGVAQGGMVDTPDGRWYCFMFHDRGALGRAPALMPMTFDASGYPVVGVEGKLPFAAENTSTRPGYVYAPLNGSDDFSVGQQNCGRNGLNRFWQFSHNPDNSLWSITERENALRIRTGKLSAGLSQARNVLTQRMTGPDCAAEVTVDGTLLNDGDFAGLCAYECCFGFIALTRENGEYYLVMRAKPAKNDTFFGDFDYDAPGEEYARIPVASPVVTLRLEAEFDDMRDRSEYFYRDGGEWKPLGITHKLNFKMDYFTGCRFGLFCYSTKETGGAADFMDFRWFGTKKRGQMDKKRTKIAAVFFTLLSIALFLYSHVMIYDKAWIACGVFFGLGVMAQGLAIKYVSKCKKAE